MSETYHKPVLLEETINFLNIEKGKRYLDATLGDGGHTLEILKKGGIVLGLDYDPNSLNRATQRIKTLGLQENFLGVCANFKDLYEVAFQNNFLNLDGVLFDFGYSSSQLDFGENGLSFNTSQALDMRLDKSLGVTAADLLNTLPQRPLELIFYNFGEVKLGRKLAKAIILARESKKFQTTNDLLEIIKSEIPWGRDNRKVNPATLVFQALRIAVNNELDNLKIALPQAARLLKLPGGRVVIISFHSLEDREVKNFGRSVRLLKSLTKKPIVPSSLEIEQNSRARSAKLRVFEALN